MKRPTGIAVVLGLGGVLFGGGCGSVGAKVERQRIASASIQFTPDVVKGNVDTWWYYFATDGSVVVGCNLKPALYEGTGWTIDEAAGTV